MIDRAKPIELLTVGRISVDLYAEQLGVPLNEVRSFRKSVGGTATNVAVATARLGHHAAVFTRLGDDPMGEYVRWALDDDVRRRHAVRRHPPVAADPARVRHDGRPWRTGDRLLPFSRRRPT